MLRVMGLLSNTHNYFKSLQFFQFTAEQHFTNCIGSIILTCGDGWVPVGSPVFKIGGGLLCRPRWVRLPSIPAYFVSWRPLNGWWHQLSRTWFPDREVFFDPWYDLRRWKTGFHCAITRFHKSKRQYSCISGNRTGIGRPPPSAGFKTG